MPRSEDYYDSLLDSVRDGKVTKKSDLKASDDKPSESPYLRDFEEELFSESVLEDEDEDMAFLRDFESELGLDPIDNSLLSSPSSEPKGSKKPRSSGNMEDLFKDIYDEFEEPELSFSDVEEGLNNAIEESEESSDTPAPLPEEDIMGALNDIMEGNPQDVAEAGVEDTNVPDAVPLEKNEAADVPPEEDDGIISDIDGDEPPVEEPAGATEETSDGEAGTGEEGNISSEEVLDIGSLLDSMDEEGNLRDSEQDAPVQELRDTPAAGSPAEKEAEGEEGEKKESFIKKLLGKILKKKDKGEGEEGEGGAPEPLEEVVVEEEEAPIDKKAAKAAEKERKKKEKEEAKKAAKAAKAEKAKEAKTKEPKAKKPKKKKEKDNSPKIPIIAIIPFLLLSVSIYVLWNVAKTNISYTLSISSAKSSYESGDYEAAYGALDGIELKEDHLLLGQRSMLLATLSYKYKAYETFSETQNLKHIYALDALVRGSVYYQDNLPVATEIAIKDSFDELGRKINDTLLQEYGLTPEDAYQLMEIKEREEYTVALYNILELLGLWSLEE